LLSSLEANGSKMYPSTHVARLWSLSIELLAAVDPKILSDGSVIENLAQTLLTGSVKLQEVE